MKRAEQLQKLSREHHGSLKMAKDIAKIVEEGNEADIQEAIDIIRKYYDDELEVHFQHEEQTIFSVIFKQYKEHIGIATVLLKEHGFIRMLIQRLSIETAAKDLADFSLVLKDHTRLEERELFPMIEALFTDEEMDAVLNFEPLE